MQGGEIKIILSPAWESNAQPSRSPSRRLRRCYVGLFNRYTIFKLILINNFIFTLRDIFDKVKADIRLMKEELASIERFRGPKERSLAQCRSSLEAMQATKEGLESELHQVYY